MKYMALSCILFFCTLQTFSQQEYFIYLQTENNQPFYIRLNYNVYSSSSTGYLILTKLSDSATAVTVGFPKNIYPDQFFNIPAVHKDAGYMLKNYGDKGWGLLNLQTQAIIMNGNGEEKKNTEITGVRRADAFSLLLANAVNDTAVLYTVVKPPKLAPAAPVAVIEEKKRDTLPASVKPEITQKDTTLTVKNIHQRKDSADEAINSQHKDRTIIAKNNKDKKDTALANKSIAPDSNLLVAKNITIIKDNPPKAGSEELPLVKKAPNNTSAQQEKPAIVKNGKDKKDTIIVIKNNAPENSQSTAKNNAATKDNPVKTETEELPLVQKTNITPRAEPTTELELPANKDALIASIAAKKDSVANKAAREKDSMALAKNDAAKMLEEKKDTTAAIPAKRLRPLVNKAAELFTDSSYVAVFVDESKDKFDTIRVSIPFNETALVKQEKPAEKPTLKKDIVSAGKSKKDSTAFYMSQPPVAATIRKDSVPADNTFMDSTLPIITHQNVPPPVKKDTTATARTKIIKDSTLPAVTATPVRKDTATDTTKTAKTGTPLLLNSDCRETALDIDIDKLRIKMLLVTTDEDRIALAKKLYKQKCFLVKHVKALSELFTTDEGKYKWFDNTYPYVYDTVNFSSLGELIKDDYYTNRFKAMLRH